MHFELDEPQDTKNPTEPPPVSQLTTAKPGSTPKPVQSMSKEENELLVPPEIKTNYVESTYNPNLVQQIILDIAATSENVEDIIKKYGLASRTVYLWRSSSAKLMQAWRAAMAHRAHVKADGFESDAAKLDNYIENDDDYKKTSNRIRGFDRKWSYRTWFMSRYNRQDFGDKLDMTQEITVNQAKEREAAYTAFQEAAIADFEDVSSIPGVQNNTTDSGPNIVG